MTISRFSWFNIAMLFYVGDSWSFKRTELWLLHSVWRWVSLVPTDCKGVALCRSVGLNLFMIIPCTWMFEKGYCRFLTHLQMKL